MIAQVSPTGLTLCRGSKSTACCVLENYAVAPRQQGRMLAQNYEQKMPSRMQLRVYLFVLIDQEKLHRYFCPTARNGSTLLVVRRDLQPHSFSPV